MLARSASSALVAGPAAASVLKRPRRSPRLAISVIMKPATLPPSSFCRDSSRARSGAGASVAPGPPAVSGVVMPISPCLSTVSTLVALSRQDHGVSGMRHGRAALYDQHRVGCRAHRQLEDVGAAVVARDIQHPLWATHLPGIELGVQDLFAFAHRAGEVSAVRADDRAVATVDPLAGVGVKALPKREAIRQVVGAQRHTTAQHVNAAFFGDVAQR